MIITPIYYCRNCKRVYKGQQQESAKGQLENFVRPARFTLGSQDHIFRIGGKTIQLSDLHMCSANEVGLANFIKLQVENESKK
jgi:hypothetical protein